MHYLDQIKLTSTDERVCPVAKNRVELENGETKWTTPDTATISVPAHSTAASEN